MKVTDIRHVIEKNPAAYGVPALLCGGLTRYVLYGIAPGGFLCAVLQNDLMGATARGEDENLANLKVICQWLYNYAPQKCHGSKEAFEAWVETHGLEGRTSNLGN